MPTKSPGHDHQVATAMQEAQPRHQGAAGAGNLPLEDAAYLKYGQALSTLLLDASTADMVLQVSDSLHGVRNIPTHSLVLQLTCPGMLQAKCGCVEEGGHMLPMVIHHAWDTSVAHALLSWMYRHEANVVWGRLAAVVSAAQELGMNSLVQAINALLVPEHILPWTVHDLRMAAIATGRVALVQACDRYMTALDSFGLSEDAPLMSLHYHAWDTASQGAAADALAAQQTSTSNCSSYRDARVGMECAHGVLRCCSIDTPLARTLLQAGRRRDCVHLTATPWGDRHWAQQRRDSFDGTVQQADDMMMMTSPLSSNDPLLLPDPRASTQCAQKPEPSNPKGKASPYPQLLWHGARSSGEGYPDSPRASCGTMHGAGSGTALGHGGIDGEPDTASSFARHAAKPDFPYVVVAPRSASSLGYFPPTCSSPAARPRTSLDHNTSSASPKQYNGPSGSPCLSPYPQRASFDASGQACVSGRESRQSIGSGALTGHGMHAAGGVAPRDSYHSERVTGVVAGRALDLLVALPVQQLQAGLHGLVWRSLDASAPLVCPVSAASTVLGGGSNTSLPSLAGMPGMRMGGAAGADVFSRLVGVAGAGWQQSSKGGLPPTPHSKGLDIITLCLQPWDNANMPISQMPGTRSAASPPVTCLRLVTSLLGALGGMEALHFTIVHDHARAYQTLMEDLTSVPLASAVSILGAAAAACTSAMLVGSAARGIIGPAIAADYYLPGPHAHQAGSALAVSLPMGLGCVDAAVLAEQLASDPCAAHAALPGLLLASVQLSSLVGLAQTIMQVVRIVCEQQGAYSPPPLRAALRIARPSPALLGALAAMGCSFAVEPRTQSVLLRKRLPDILAVINTLQAALPTPHCNPHGTMDMHAAQRHVRTGTPRRSLDTGPPHTAAGPCSAPLLPSSTHHHSGGTVPHSPGPLASARTARHGRRSSLDAPAPSTYTPSGPPLARNGRRSSLDAPSHAVGTSQGRRSSMEIYSSSNAAAAASATANFAFTPQGTSHCSTDGSLAAGWRCSSSTGYQASSHSSVSGVPFSSAEGLHSSPLPMRVRRESMPSVVQSEQGAYVPYGMAGLHGGVMCAGGMHDRGGPVMGLPVSHLPRLFGGRALHVVEVVAGVAVTEF